MPRRRLALIALLLPPLAALPVVPLAFPSAVAAPAEGGAAAEDMGFLVKLALMEGHLIIGQELLQAGRQALALPHFGHPVRELYDDIEEDLRRRNVHGFEAELLRLEAAATAAPTAPATVAQYQVVIAAVHRARDAVPASLRGSVPQMIRVCADVLDVAAGEYGEALERGRIRNVVEYHDSRGFVFWAVAEIQRLQTAAPAAEQALIARFRPAMEGMRQVVDTLLPPGAPRASIAEYRALARQAGEAAGQ
jgi:hypothetical protein